MGTNREELRAFIRYQLGQLRKLNRAHAFEDLCRAWARSHVVGNILPATGPVSAGGDQGRDFETYLTYLHEHIKDAGVFAGLSSTDRIVFCCTTQQEGVPSKVRADLKTACGTGTRVDAIFYFSEADVAVAKRHELIEEAKRDHNVALEIVDGQALAESLASDEDFWIAVQYLDLPSHLEPPTPAANDPDWYRTCRARWLSSSRPASTLGDLLSITNCLTYAKRESAADLALWIELLDAFVHPDAVREYRQRARYEISVARLRGLGDIRGAEHHVGAYFEEVLAGASPTEVFDAAILMHYLCGAWMMNLTSLTASQIAERRQSTVATVLSLLDAEPDPGRRSELLHSLTIMYLTPDLADVTQSEVRALVPSPKQLKQLVENGDLQFGPPSWNAAAALECLQALMEAASSAPLFPVRPVAETVSMNTAAMADLSGWAELTAALDERVSVAAGRFEAGRQSWERAVRLRGAGRPLAALRELHRARERAVSAGSAEAGALALLEAAECYIELGQLYAAKHHAMCAVALASSVDSAAPTATDGLFLVAQADYLAGNWMTLLTLLPQALSNYLEVKASDDDVSPSVEIQEYMRMLLLIGHAAAEVFSAEDQKMLDSQLTSAGWPPEDDALEAIKKVATLPSSIELLNELGQPPFADVGPQRLITWTSCGIRWELICQNEYEDVMAAERFVSVAQSAGAALADRELALSQTTVEVRVKTLAPQGKSPRNRPAERKSREDGRSWSIWLTRDRGPDSLNYLESHAESLASFLAVLGSCSYLKADDLRSAITVNPERMLEAITPHVRYDRAYGTLISKDQFAASTRRKLSRLPETRFSDVLVGDELRPRSSWGPGFSLEKGEERAQDHYAIYAEKLKHTLRRLNGRPEFQAAVSELRSDGWKDRHILLALGNQVLNYRLALQLEGGREIDPDAEMANYRKVQEETDELPIVPAEEVTAESLRQFLEGSYVATLRAWQLDVNDPVHEPHEVETFLAQRYSYWDLDVPHVDPFVYKPNN